MANGEIPVGTIAVETVVDTEGIERALRSDIPRTAQAGGEEAAARFGSSFERRAMAAAQEVLSGLASTFEAEKQALSDALSRGVIRPEEFERQGAEAARQYQRSLETSLQDLEQHGLVTPGVRAAFQREWDRAGSDSGRRFGESVDRSARHPLQNLQGWIRGTFVVGMVTGFMMVGRRISRFFKNVASEIRALLEEAGQEQLLARGFRELTTARGLMPADVLREMRAGTRGLVEDTELLRLANKALQAELPVTAAQMGTLAGNARRLGETVGVDAEQAFRMLTEAIATGQVRGLRQLGVVVDLDLAYRTYAESVGKVRTALTEQEQTQARLNAILPITNRMVQALGEHTLTPAQRMQQLQVAIANTRSEILLAIAETPRLIQLMDHLGISAENAGEKFQQWGQGVGVAVDAMAELMMQAGAWHRFFGMVRGDLFGLVAIFGGFRREAEMAAEVRLGRMEVREQADAMRANIARLSTLRDETGLLNEHRRLHGMITEERARQLQLSGAELEVSEERVRQLEALQQRIKIVLTGMLMPGTADPTVDPNAAARKQAIDRAQADLEALRREIELAQSFGFPALDAVPPKLRTILAEILSLQRETDRWQEIFDTLGIEPTGALLEFFEHLQQRLREAEEEAQAIDIPGLLFDEAEAARGRLQELGREFQALRAIGLGAVLDIPPALRQAAIEADAAARQFAQAEADLEALGDQATEAERATVEMARRTAEETAEARDALRDVRALLQSFPSVTPETFMGLDPAQIQAVQRAMDELVVSTNRVTRLRQELTRAMHLGTEEEARAAQEALNDALREYEQIWARVRVALEAAGIPAAQIDRIMEDLRTHTEGAAEATTGLMDALSEASRVVRGITRIADAAGLLDRNLRRALDSAVDVFDALQNLRTATGALDLSSVFQLGAGAIGFISGVAGLVGGMFGGGESPEVARHREALTRSLDNLRSSLDRAAQAFLGIPAELFAQARRAIEAVGGRVGFLGQRLAPQLREAGLGPAEVRRLGEALGIEVTNLVRLLQGEKLDVQELAAAVREFGALQEAIDLAADAARRFFKETFAGQMELLQREFELFDIDEPIDQLRRMLKVFLEFTKLPADLQARIDALDLRTEEGRAELKEVIKELFRRFKNDPEFAGVGALEPREFLEALDRINGTLEDVMVTEEDAITTSAGVFRGVTEVQADRLVGIGQTQLFFQSRYLPDLAETNRRILTALGGTIEGLEDLQVLFPRMGEPPQPERERPPPPPAPGRPPPPAVPGQPPPPAVLPQPLPPTIQPSVLAAAIGEVMPSFGDLQVLSDLQTTELVDVLSRLVERIDPLPQRWQEIRPPDPRLQAAPAGRGDIYVEVHGTTVGPISVEGVQDADGFVRELARLGAPDVEGQVAEQVRRRLRHRGVPQ